MKQTMFTIEIRNPKSREAQRREMAERFISLITWMILIAGILAAAAGILHSAGRAGAVTPALYEPVTPHEIREISAILTAAESQKAATQ